jgi:hypothetical protein
LQKENAEFTKKARFYAVNKRVARSHSDVKESRLRGEPGHLGQLATEEKSQQG